MTDRKTDLKIVPWSIPNGFDIIANGTNIGTITATEGEVVISTNWRQNEWFMDSTTTYSDYNMTIMIERDYIDGVKSRG